MKRRVWIEVAGEDAADLVEHRVRGPERELDLFDRHSESGLVPRIDEQGPLIRMVGSGLVEAFEAEVPCYDELLLELIEEAVKSAPDRCLNTHRPEMESVFLDAIA